MAEARCFPTEAQPGAPSFPARAPRYPCKRKIKILRKETIQETTKIIVRAPGDTHRAAIVVAGMKPSVGGKLNLRLSVLMYSIFIF